MFEVIAVSGNDDAQAMARGVYRATIPTMAGLVVASPVFISPCACASWRMRGTGRLVDRLTLQQHRVEHTGSAPMTARRHLPAAEETELDMTPCWTSCSSC